MEIKETYLYFQDLFRFFWIIQPNFDPLAPFGPLAPSHPIRPFSPIWTLQPNLDHLAPSHTLRPLLHSFDPFWTLLDPFVLSSTIWTLQTQSRPISPFRTLQKLRPFWALFTPLAPFRPPLKNQSSNFSHFSTCQILNNLNVWIVQDYSSSSELSSSFFLSSLLVSSSCL